MTSFKRKIGYELNPPLTRHIDYDGLITDAMDAIKSDDSLIYYYKHSKETDPLMIEAILKIEFPDLNILKKKIWSEEHAREMYWLLKEKILNAWYGMVKEFDMWFKDHIIKDEFLEHHASYSHSGKALSDLLWESEFKIELGLIGYGTIHALETCLRRVVEPKTFQQAKNTRIQINLKQCKIGSHSNENSQYFVSGRLYDASARIKPIKNWLTLEKKEEIMKFFQNPMICKELVSALKGFKIGADEAREKSEHVKRWRIGGIEMIVDEARDVVDLVKEQNLFAFYPAIKHPDETVGRLVIDMDVQPGLSLSLGPSRTWEVCCNVSEVIVENFCTLGRFSPPARHFSGSRGIHIVWNVENDLDPMYLEDGTLNMPRYLNAIYTVDNRLGSTKSGEKWRKNQNFALKLILQAGCLHAFFNSLVEKPLLKKRERHKLGIFEDVYIATFLKDDPGSYYKIVLDMQPTCHRWLSPHYKSGLISRNILNGNNAIKLEFRDHETIQQKSRLDFVLEQAKLNPNSLRESPGFVSMAAIDELCAPHLFGPDVCMLVKYGHINAAIMDIKTYQKQYKTYSWELGRLKNDR